MEGLGENVKKIIIGRSRRCGNYGREVKRNSG